MVTDARNAPHGAAHRVRVLIVDDSALVRRLLTDLLSSDAGIEVVGAAVRGMTDSNPAARVSTVPL